MASTPLPNPIENAPVKRFRLTDTLQFDDLDYSAWRAAYSSQPVLAVYHNRYWGHSGTGIVDQPYWYDFTEWIAEDGLQIVHEELDKDGSGRDVKRGRMKRSVITEKHTLNVKFLDRMPHDVAWMIFQCVDSLPHPAHGDPRYSFWVIYNWPCGDAMLGYPPGANVGGVYEAKCEEMYKATFDYGTQRYFRGDGRIYYYGANIKLVQM